MSKTYTIEKHQHRLAAWAASRAASASKLCRFKVQDGVAILEDSGFDAGFSIKKDLPIPKDIDQTHKKWRITIIEKAKGRGLEFSHGVAAKIINCYLKVRFVCAGKHKHERVRFLHPPIDSLLLKKLAETDFGGHGKKWHDFHNLRWSNFDSPTYQKVIKLIRESLNGQSLWKIEEYWDGYQ